MPGVSRVRKDFAGGLIIGELQSSVFVNGFPVTVHDALVAPHGDSPHNAATMIAGAKNVFINSIRVVKEGDFATCGHKSTGSSNVFVG